MLRRTLATLAVLAACAGAGWVMLAVYSIERRLDVGTVRVSADAHHEGALDLYVPLVDWGVRFPGAVRVPARVALDLRTVDRGAVERLARGSAPDVDSVRGQADGAIEDWVTLMLAFAGLAALALGGLVALALRGRAAPLRLLAPAALAGAALTVLALYLLVPPRGDLADPEYYANGPDIPAALRAIDGAQDSASTISEDLDAQLVGLARLIAEPGERGPATRLRRLTLASDLHNNLLALPALERAVDGGPLVFAGDLTDSGSPFEAALTARVAGAGDPVVFVAGNHDSDVLVQQLADAGVIVLGRRGRLLRGGRRGKVVQRVAGLRMAGYESPNVRLRRERYRDRGAEITDAQRQDFADWLRPLIGNVDVVVAHEQGLVEDAAAELRGDPPSRPLVLLTGHTHLAVAQASRNLLELNGGSAGGGGTGNLADDQPFGLGVLLFERGGGFRPRFADTVEIDADSGAARAERLPVVAER